MTVLKSLSLSSSHVLCVLMILRRMNQYYCVLVAASMVIIKSRLSILFMQHITCHECYCETVISIEYFTST